MYNLTQQQQQEVLRGREDARNCEPPRDDNDHYRSGYRYEFDRQMAELSGIDGDELFRAVIRGNA